MARKSTTKSVRLETEVSDREELDESEKENPCPVPSKKPKLRKSKKKTEICESPEFKVKNPPCNILKYYRNYEMGLPCQKYKKPLKDMVINYCRTFRLYKVESPFDRRVTFIVWHPTNPKVLSVTSHGGDVILYNYEQDINSACMIKGIGAGGSVQSMKFDLLNPVQIYTASMEGKFLVLNFHTKQAKQFLETNDINRWYVSVDVNSKNNLMVAGDTKGKLTILTLQGEVINTSQVHKKGFKVNHAEFSQREAWLLCTSSTDGTMKLWDIRNLKSDSKEKLEPLQTIVHEKPINAAYFSLTDGCRLLTTDQLNKIAIYRAPLWNLETVIHHPHRQFQHLTPIKAYWHPFEDIVFAGRYPHCKFPGYHENELRTLDFFDADTGELLYQHYQTGLNGILCLNRFNNTGDALASSYGRNFLIWKPNFKNLERASRTQDKLSRDGKKNNNHFPDDGNDDDGNDDDKDDDGEIDWQDLLKKQAKERRDEKKKKAKKG